MEGFRLAEVFWTSPAFFSSSGCPGTCCDLIGSCLYPSKVLLQSSGPLAILFGNPLTFWLAEKGIVGKMGLQRENIHMLKHSSSGAEEEGAEAEVQKCQ